MSVESASTQLPRPMPELQCDISCPCVASQVVGRMPKFRTFSGDFTHKGEVSFEQWAFEVRSVMQSHRGNVGRENSMIFMQSHG